MFGRADHVRRGGWARSSAWAAVLSVALCSAAISAAAGPVLAGAASPRESRVVLQGSALGPVRLGTTQRSATTKLTLLLGHPTGYLPPGCVGGYRNVEWSDLIAQFKQGRLVGYRYWITKPNQKVTPRLFTAAGITLGSTFAAVKRAYPHLTQTGTDFWNSGGLTFGLASSRYPSPPSAPVYEIKVNACPAAL